MREAINRLLGLKTAASPHKTGTTAKPGLASAKGAPADKRDSPHTIEDNSDNGTRRQLVQMLLRDCLRRHGMAPGSVEGLMLLVNSRSRGPGMYVRLVMRQWDPRLLTYAFAFQKELLDAITQFEPQAGSWLHGISWEFNLTDNNCPYPDMPDATFWQGQAPATPVPAPGRAAKATATAAAAALPQAGAADDEEVRRDLQDLQNMFAARDASLDEAAAAGDHADFQATLPSRLG